MAERTANPRPQKHNYKAHGLPFHWFDPGQQKTRRAAGWR